MAKKRNVKGSVSRKVRSTQAITPFGVGAICDFPQESLMTAGLNFWPNDVNDEDKIFDDRLSSLLDCSYFVKPPVKGLPMVRFPLWTYCPRCKRMEKTRWNDQVRPTCKNDVKLSRGGDWKLCGTLEAWQRKIMIPVRFVAACENSHISDFPWVEWAHSRPGVKLNNVQLCDNPVLFYLSGKKAGLGNIRIKCATCGSFRTMDGSCSKNALEGLACNGEKPWLGAVEGKGECELNKRTYQRGATNLYFSKSISSILIPPLNAKVAQIIRDKKAWILGEDDAQVKEKRLAMLSEMEGIPVQELKRVLNDNQNADKSETNYRLKEYNSLQGEHQKVEGDLFCLPQPMASYGDFAKRFFSSISVVEKLAVTRALIGFSRAKPANNPTEVDHKTLSTNKKNWLPAVRIYGEGIFLKIDQERLELWSQQDSVKERYRKMIESHHADCVRRERDIKENLSCEFFALHTLAHALIRRLSFECGYGSSSLRERIYCCDENDKEMAGILIYTAAGDADGTMGGLASQADASRFEQLLRNTLLDTLACSNDPLCLASTGQGIGSLNKAACYACALIPETGCEEGNRFLDRVALVGTPASPELGLFGREVAEMME